MFDVKSEVSDNEGLCLVPWCVSKAHIRLCFVPVLNFDTLSAVFLGKMSFATHIDAKHTFSCVFKTHLPKQPKLIYYLHKFSTQNISNDPQVV